MEKYLPETYGERIADTYDSFYSTVDPDSIELITEIAHSGNVLELGIGTGRVAIPLYNNGIRISGIDSSQAMINLLHTKSNGAHIPVTIGDFSELNINESFDLIFIVFNTIFALITQELQIKCFDNVSKHLNTGGKFLIEAFVPDIGRFDRGQTVRLTNVSTDEVRIDASSHDTMTQQVNSQNIVLSEKGIKLYPVTIRYAWPSELDLMARLAGMKLIQRWADWKRTPFNSQSVKHISLYEIKK